MNLVRDRIDRIPSGDVQLFSVEAERRSINDALCGYTHRENISTSSLSGRRRPWITGRLIASARCSRTALVAALLFTACSAPLGCGGQPGGPRAIPPKPGGMAVGFNEEPSAGSFSRQRSLGMPLRRFNVPWNQVETAPGVWNWTAYDRDYRAMLDAGLKPVLLAIGAPCWTRPGRACAPGVPDAAFDPQWAEYVRRLTERYPAAVGVEVWNEPNITPTFPPYPDPNRYAALLEAAHAAVKSVNPELPVVSGGLFAAPATGPYGIADSQFLAALYEAGAGDSIDAIGVHPYPTVTDAAGVPARYDLGAMEQALDRIRSVRDAAGYSGTPIWITEVGVSTASAPGFPRGATEVEQAQLLLAAVDAAGRADDVEVTMIHRLVDTLRPMGASPLAAIESGFGVFDSTGKPKLAACALARRFRGSLACGGLSTRDHR
jgi:hypothetical protein